MKSLLRFLLIIWIICYGFFGNIEKSNAANIKVWDSPADILGNVYYNANKDWTLSSQFNTLARPGYAVWTCGTENKICLAVEAVRAAISPYINFAVFIVLFIAVILIIYNWFNLVIWKWDAKEITEAKTKIFNIILWIIIISWFVIIIRMLMSVVVMITGQ